MPYRLPVRSETFDDDEDDSLVVLSGSDVLSIHYGHGPDEDKAEERSAIDKRRGLVLAQVAVLEDLVDEIIIYLDDPVDADAYRKKLPRMLGPRLERLTELLEAVGLDHLFPLDRLKALVDRRNVLAHGSLFRDVSVWRLYDRRPPPSQGRREPRSEPVYMSRLRRDLEEAQDCLLDILGSLEVFVEQAPWPRHFDGGEFLPAPTP